MKPFTIVALLGAGPADTPVLLCAVQRVMSGLTASGPGPNCEIDVMGQRTKSLRDSPLRGAGELIKLNPLSTEQGYVGTVIDLD